MPIQRASRTKKREPLDKEALIELIWVDLVNGVSRYQVKLKLDRDSYDGFTTSKLSRATKYYYIAEAYKNCEAERREEREKQRDLFFERILSVYNDSIMNRDRQNALKALDMGCKLANLYPKEEKDINLNGNINANISFGLDKEEEDED